MLGEKIRIDFGPDSFYHQQRYGLAYERLEALVFTHAHEDHLQAYEFYYRRPGFSRIPETDTLAIYGNRRVEERIGRAVDDDWARHRVRFQPLTAFERFELPDGVSVTPVPADHDRSQACFNLVFESGSHRLLIGHDSGWWEEPTWEFLKSVVLDVALLDCTGGPQETRRGHMSCTVVCEVRDRLREQGSLAPGARVIATHFSHNGGWLHDELEAYLNPRAIEVAYDGMRVEVEG
jgi:phosphoribosyl 1,2-cyclic phosphate phosphodiesterase